MRLECRECDVICQRVVYPWHCLRSNCEYVYSYEDGDTMYFGCLGKVFSAEFDMAVFAERREQVEPGQDSDEAGPPAKKATLARRGRRRRSLKSNDPFGAVRLTRPPRPQCHVRIEQAYDTSPAGSTCCNPTFFHQEFGSGGDSMKFTAPPPGDPNASQS
jgi:hypothetical protein